MKTRILFILALLSVVIVSQATAAPKKTEKKEPPVPIFFPAAPDEPRLQFLMGFASSDDFEKSPSAFRKFIVGDKKETKPLMKPYGVTVHDRKIYLCDTVLGGIEILDFKTRKFEYFIPKGGAQLRDPINLDFDSAGHMYVADARLGQVIIFDKDANYMGTIGQNSEYKPTDILIRNDQAYFCDLKSNSVKVIRLKDKELLLSIPLPGAKDEAKLFSPTNLAMDQEGNLYVSDTGAFRVQKYNNKGEFVMSIGSQGDAMGEFARPKGVAVDREGRIYAVDASFENVQIFDKDGKLLLFFPEQKSESVPLILPAGITLDDTLIEYFSPLVHSSFKVEYLVLVTSQYGGRKLNVFGFGHKK